MIKYSITYSNNHNFARIIIDSYSSLPMEKALTFHNVIIRIKSFFTRIKAFTTRNVGIDVNKAGKSKECNIVCY